jgi:uncharacterized protein
MVVGSMRVRLLVRSITDRLRQSFNVAVAEVDARDICQSIVFGIVAVGEEAREVKTTLDRIADALRAHPVAEFVSADTVTEQALI